MSRRKTREEHIADIAKHGKVELLGDYEKAHTRTTYRCLTHGEEHEALPYVIAQGGGLWCCNSKRLKTRDEHVAALAVFGKVELLGAYINSATRTLYRCLEHGEEHEASPRETAQGTGLVCCKSGGKGDENHGFKRAQKSYDQRLAKVGRCVRVGEYKGATTPILHRCLAHGEEHEAQPSNLYSGQGLICCRVAAREKTSARWIEEAASGYDARLAVHGKVLRLEPYAGMKTPILHRCLIHGEEHRAVPGQCLAGHGLKCCGIAVSKDTGAKRFEVSAISYDAELASFGKVERLEDYAGSHTPILHRCLIHREEHKSFPSDCRRGGGLKCCQRAAFSVDSIDFALEGSKRYEKAEETSLYIYELENHPGYLKPGIAKDLDFRSRCSNGEYGDLVAEWRRDLRLHVYLPEQVLLRATRLLAHCPPGLAGWVGATEVRRIDADALVGMAQELMDELDSCANPWEFAIAHGLLTPEQEKRAWVLIRAGVVSEAELAPERAGLCVA
jgi:hypothetical protein